MDRKALTDGSGRWFDRDKAEHFSEESYHDGNNFISKATKSQWHHEKLYLTKSGVFILRTYSNYQGVDDTYTLIDDSKAAEWFAKQEFEESEIPERLRPIVNTYEIE